MLGEKSRYEYPNSTLYGDYTETKCFNVVGENNYLKLDIIGGDISPDIFMYFVQPYDSQSKKDTACVYIKTPTPHVYTNYVMFSSEYEFNGNTFPEWFSNDGYSWRRSDHSKVGESPEIASSIPEL